MTDPIPLDLTDLRPGVIWRVAGHNLEIRQANQDDAIRWQWNDANGGGHYVHDIRTMLTLAGDGVAADAKPRITFWDGSWPIPRMLMLAGGTQAWAFETISQDTDGWTLQLVRAPGEDPPRKVVRTRADHVRAAKSWAVWAAGFLVAEILGHAYWPDAWWLVGTGWVWFVVGGAYHLGWLRCDKDNRGTS